MKKILITLCLLFATPIAGCSMIGQSSAANKSLKDHDYKVDKVVVKVKNGKKSADVFIFGKVSASQREEIKELVQAQIPDAEEIKIIEK